jgi:recombination protein RecR
MNSIEKLTEIFSKFPGIGPRQARRFVYYLLHQNDASLRNFTDLILRLPKEVSRCLSCLRFAKTNTKNLCAICDDSNRDRSMLLVVAKDVDLENIEKTHTYNGRYFVLGNMIPLTEKASTDKARTKELQNEIRDRENEIKEIIIAMATNVEGDHTTDILKELLEPVTKKNNITVSVLGRGMSTGTELEYSDADTINNALRNRKGVV